jgi:hypothetical protein
MESEFSKCRNSGAAAVGFGGVVRKRRPLSTSNSHGLPLPSPSWMLPTSHSLPVEATVQSFFLQVICYSVRHNVFH